MEKVQVHNKRLNVWFVVDNGKVYFADTMVQLPSDSYEAQGALWYVGKRMEMVRETNKQEWLRLRKALYGNN